MKTQTFQCTIKGLTPYMQHRHDDLSLEEWEKNRGKIIERKDIALEDKKRADFHSYIDEEGYYMPTEHIKQCLINAGSFMKSKVGNSRKSMSNIIASTFRIPTLKLRLPEYDEIDKRSAVNRNVKARIITLRPKWNNWEVTFDLNILNNTITKETIKELFLYAGIYVGIGSYNPLHKGEHGTFELINIKNGEA